MAPVVTSAEIDRPAAEVFAYATDPARRVRGERLRGADARIRACGAAGATLILTKDYPAVRRAELS